MPYQVVSDDAVNLSAQKAMAGHAAPCRFQMVTFDFA
jgi:hypothetical protein